MKHVYEGEGEVCAQGYVYGERSMHGCMHMGLRPRCVGGDEDEIEGEGEG